MDSRRVSLTLMLLVVVILFTSTKGKTTAKSKVTVEWPLFVGSFNIQNLGNSKFNNKTVMAIIKQILVRYDLVLIQEIVTLNASLMDNLVNQLNQMTPEGKKYQMVISERLGRGNAKEQYAFLYRSDKLKHLSSRTYPNDYDEFMRPPFIAKFATPTLRDMTSMLAIGIHTQPKNAANETSSLADVYDYAAETFKVKDAIIMGDMNAGCANVRISDWDNIELWRRPEFEWLITHDIDTTLSTNCCPYDRFVIAGERMNGAYILGSAKSFKYGTLYKVSTEMALAVSDHWPIEMKLRGATSKEAESNLIPSLCLSIKDERKKTLPSAFLRQKTTFGFSIDADKTWATLYSESRNTTVVLENLADLANKYEEFLSVDISDAVRYKVEHGALDDITSNNDLKYPLSSAEVTFDKGYVTVDFCRRSTIN